MAGNLERGRELLTVADTEVADARTDLTARGPAAAVVSGRAAEDAMTQAETMLDGFSRLESELIEAASRIPAARAELTQDLAEAATMDEVVAGLVARAEAAMASADQAVAGPRPDPIGALRLLNEAGHRPWSSGLEQARAEQDRFHRAAAALAQALLTARSAVAAAEDFIGTRRGAVGADRTHPAGRGAAAPAAGRRRRRPGVRAGRGPAGRRTGPRGARAWRDPMWTGGRAGSGSSGSGLGVDLGSLVLGGILSGAFGGEYRRGGGYGGASAAAGGVGGGGFGGRSPGSFGGSSTRGRRGGGGRF